MIARPKTFDRDDVLYKVLQVFCKQGYESTSMQDLVDAMGINRASIYNTFGDKEKLCYESLAIYRETNVKSVRAYLASQVDIKESLRQPLYRSIDESESGTNSKGCFVLNSAAELRPQCDQMLQGAKSNKEVFESMLVDHMKRGQRMGQINKGVDVKSFASLVFTLYSGLKMISKMDPSVKETKSSVDLILQIL